MMLLTPFFMTLLLWCKKHHPKLLGVMVWRALPWLASVVVKTMTNLIEDSAVNSVQLSPVDEGSSRCHYQSCLTTQLASNLSSKHHLGMIV